MKSIPNKTFDSKPETTSTAKLLSQCLTAPLKEGFDFATIRARNRVQDVLDKVEDGGVIELEDADYSAAVEAVKSARWNTPAKHLVSFAEQFGL